MVQTKYSPKNRIDIRGQIAGDNELLALPVPVHTVLRMSKKEANGIGMPDDIFGEYPALAKRFLKIANSSFYHSAKHITSFKQAVICLGLTNAKSLLLAAALFDMPKISAKSIFDMKTLYGNIITVAVASEKLAIVCNYPSPEDAFICGLLHEIGLMFYLQNYQVEYREVIKSVNETKNLFSAEQEYFGLDHCEAGRLITAKLRVPLHITGAILNHHSFGIKTSEPLDDIVRLAVTLNVKLPVALENDIEERILKINSICERLKLRPEQIDDVIATTMPDSISFASQIDVEIEDSETYLTRANREIFRTYMQIHQLFRERQELTRSILDEERARGIFETKQIAISTMSHYINNASMIISGQSQVIRLSLKKKADSEVAKSLPPLLDIIDESIRKIVAVLGELTEVNMVDDVAFFDRSKILNIDDRIRERVNSLETNQVGR